MTQRIIVKLKPGAPQTKILKREGNLFSIAVQAPPHDNKANKALLQLLRKTFKRPVILVKGLKSREKIVEIL